MHFVFAIVLSLLLMVFDYHFHYLNRVRSLFISISSPMQYVVDYPIRMTNLVSDFFGARNTLINENINLRYQQTILEARLQKLTDISDENKELKKLLSVSSTFNSKAEATEILAVDTSSSRQVWIINKGSSNGVYEGQPLLDAKGVVGQVIDVGFITSTVLLISDLKSAVPIRNNRTGEQAILVGTNHINKLSLINMPKTAAILEGDILVTSGLGRLYPEGYPVGKVNLVKDMPGEDFMRVEVAPIARLNRDRIALLLWPDMEKNHLLSQIDERLNILNKK